jgi:hypothetical protein
MAFQEIGVGWPATERTLSGMADLAGKATRDFKFIQTASKIVAQCPARDHNCEAGAILDFVKSYVRFQPDPLTSVRGHMDTVELIQAPQVTLKRRAGDCDDQAVLIAALGMALGMPAKFVVIKCDTKMPDEFSHVWCELDVAVGGDQWVALDSVVPESFPGWTPQRYWEKKEWRI